MRTPATPTSADRDALWPDFGGFVESQSRWAAQALALQTAWLASCWALQGEWLARSWDPALCPAWMVWHNGTEQLA